MASFIDEHRGRYGVGPIPAFAGMTGAQLPTAPSTYYEHKVREAQPGRAPARVRRDGWRCGEIRRVYDEHFGVYGVRKVWRQLRREGGSVARCTPAPEPHRGVARRMRRLGLQGAVRGRQAKTTTPVADAERPADRVNRVFTVSRPDALRVSDLTPVSTGGGSTWPRGGCAPGAVQRSGRRGAYPERGPHGAAMRGGGAVAEVLGEPGPEPAARPEVPERFAATLRFLSGAPMAAPETPNLVVGMALATLAADWRVHARRSDPDSGGGGRASALMEPWGYAVSPWRTQPNGGSGAARYRAAADESSSLANPKTGAAKRRKRRIDQTAPRMRETFRRLRGCASGTATDGTRRRCAQRGDGSEPTAP